MADNSKIEWTDATWNPITGCSVVSPGCTNCYAMKLAGTRLQHHPSRAGLTRESKAGPVWTGETRFNAEWLDQPLRWRRPRMIFVCAHGDLFHENVPDEWIDQVFAVMALAPHHTFQVLTKRAARMQEYLSVRARDWMCILPAALSKGTYKLSPHAIVAHIGLATPEHRKLYKASLPTWPLPNVWLGVSVEDQTRADERIPDLLATPAAVRFISAEPLLGPVEIGFALQQTKDEFGNWRSGRGLDWAIVGGESGDGARPMHPDWARSLRDQCDTAGVSLHFKQWGDWFPRSQWEHNPELVLPDDECAEWPDSKTLVRSDGETFHNVGKDSAGRRLDGVEHNGMPGEAHD